MANPRHNTQTTNQRGVMMKKRPGYNAGKLVGGQVKIASAAAPKDKITGADFKALKKRKA